MTLVVDRYELGPIGTNCYVVRVERGAPGAVVIDPGGDAAQLRLELAQMATRCEGIIVTHTHYDHIGGVADLAEGTGARVYISEVEAPVLARPDDYYPGMRIRSHQADVLLSGDETFETALSSPATCSSRARSAAPTCRGPTGRRSSRRSGR